jgi:hypothetical protein
MRRSKLEKIKEAENRQSERSKRSNKDQLAVLDSRLGKDVGASKERLRLKSLIENPPASDKEKPKKKKKAKQEAETN